MISRRPPMMIHSKPIITSFSKTFTKSKPSRTRVNRNLEKDVCTNHNYGSEENLGKAVRRYLRCIGSWPKL
jgi:hypothetical protein